MAQNLYHNLSSFEENGIAKQDKSYKISFATRILNIPVSFAVNRIGVEVIVKPVPSRLLTRKQLLKSKLVCVKSPSILINTMTLM